MRASTRRARGTVLVAVLALSLVLTPPVWVVLAAPVTLPQTLNGGGPGGSEWDIENDTDDGFQVAEGTLLGPPSQGDAFDGAAIIQVDGGSIILPGGESATVDREGQTITGGPVTLSGLNVTVQYHALTSSATLRVLASFQNPTGAPISATASFLSNLGSDSDTVARGTSSGDTGVTAADRWVVTDDDRDTGGDPDVTHVFFGPGRPRVAPDVIVLLQTEALFAPYRITAPANQTRRLLFFIQLNQTHTQALANAAAFDTNPAPRSDLLNGLSEAQLAEVLNFRFAGNLPPTVSDIPNQTTPEDTPTGPISFTVGDEETPAGSLSVTATTRSWAATASTSSRATRATT